MKPKLLNDSGAMSGPAAFRRLCVETPAQPPCRTTKRGQPPSGGCVLKLAMRHRQFGIGGQPPSGGCVLKRSIPRAVCRDSHQPPSGGCVLKLDDQTQHVVVIGQPPSGGCVLKHFLLQNDKLPQPPAAFRRLCVETRMLNLKAKVAATSRLQAAVC